MAVRFEFVSVIVSQGAPLRQLFPFGRSSDRVDISGPSVTGAGRGRRLQLAHLSPLGRHSLLGGAALLDNRRLRQVPLEGLRGTRPAAAHSLTLSPATLADEKRQDVV